MNKLLIALFAGLLSTQAIGAVSDVDRALVEKGFNVFRNGGAENGKADWTASGGTLTAVSGSKSSGQLGISWDSNAASQTLVLSSVSNIPDGLKGRNGTAVCKIRTPSGVGTHTFTVDDGTNNIVASQTIPYSTNFASAVVNFVFPTSSVPLRFKLTSVAANEPAIDIDECVATDAFNIFQLSQFGSYESFTPTFTGFGTVASSTIKARRTPQGVQFGGVFTAGTPTAVEARISLPFSCTSASDYGTLERAWGDGSRDTSTDNNPVPLIEPNVAYITFGVGSAGIQLQKRNGTELLAAGAKYSFFAEVRCQGSAPNTVFAPEIQNVWGSTYWTDGTSTFSTTSAAYVSVTGANVLGTATRVGSAAACADTSAICLKIPSLPAGSYKVEYAGNTGGNGAAGCSIAISDGSTDYELAAGNAPNASAGHTIIVYNSAQQNKEFTLRTKRTVGAGTCTVDTAYNIGHNLTVSPADQKLPAPILVGSVTNGSTGAMRVEAAVVAAPSGGACTVTESGSSDWISGNATSGGTGLCAITFNTGVFSAAPVCACTGVIAAGNSRYCNHAGETSTTVTTQTSSSAGTMVSDTPIRLVCVGPR